MVKNNSKTNSKSLGKLFQFYLPAKTHRIYSCLHCRAQLASHDELISKVNFIFVLKSNENPRFFLLSSHFKAVKAVRIYSIQCMFSLRIEIVFLFILILYSKVLM